MDDTDPAAPFDDDDLLTPVTAPADPDAGNLFDDELAGIHAGDWDLDADQLWGEEIAPPPADPDLDLPLW
ncbi:hypothetical protein JOD63_002211 [Microbacterium terrae]|uniref:Uncharacterized protein n=1 Tax=Microbacterium terrae TaxID=69369 RepID=A0A0M2H9W9_9MICO|nr:hypothetical protein [Microbacterium terrae]KJL40954.1 hypothetical protein RS81_01498 [Microbacterium terrae]MBP1078243.1 hypothetical protein [Microbacterium terrae]GLJ97722.1 hypothetical protein GCM10017594_09190 [Microbacterium terrae]